MASVTEVVVAFRGYRTWWRRYAPPDDAEGRVPLIAVHGGPGMPWVLDDSALELAGHLGRPVVFYHQVGCGRSDRPDDPSLWSVEFFVDNLANLRRELSLDDVHIYGISWGGMLALAYLLTQPAGVRSVVLASAIPSVPLFEQEARRLVDGMPAAVRSVLRRARPAPGSEHRGTGQVLPGLTEREIEAKRQQLAKMLPLLTTRWPLGRPGSGRGYPRCDPPPPRSPSWPSPGATSAGWTPCRQQPWA